MREPGRASTPVSNSSSSSVPTSAARARAPFPAGSTASTSSTRTPSELSSPVRADDGCARTSSRSALRSPRDLRRAPLWCAYERTLSVATAAGPGCSPLSASRCIGQVSAALRLRMCTRTSETLGQLRPPLARAPRSAGSSRAPAIIALWIRCGSTNGSGQHACSRRAARRPGPSLAGGYT